MKSQIQLEILPQPDDFTCGPTCLHAVYSYFDDEISLTELIREIQFLEEGGTLAVLLAQHALKRGYKATMYTFNMEVFDPTWKDLDRAAMMAKLEEQYEHKHERRLRRAIRAYLEFLRLGGTVKMRDLNPSLIRKLLKKRLPVLTGLSATWLYQSMRERPPDDEYDDIHGYVTGHFVVLSGYDLSQKLVRVADPYRNNPGYTHQYYDVKMDRLICSILLGILTYDANLLVIEPAQPT